MARRARRDAGQVLPFAAVFLALGLAIVVVLGTVGSMLVDAAEARTAADAAALAGARYGRPAAEQVARRNGAELVAFATHRDDTVVTVRIGRAEATARARRTEVTPPRAPERG